METSAIIGMIFVLGFIWGGFFFWLRMAYHKETKENR